MENEEDEDDEAEELEDQHAKNRKKRMSKSDLYKAYSGRGPIRMFSDLIHASRQTNTVNCCFTLSTKTSVGFSDNYGQFILTMR